MIPFKAKKAQKQNANQVLVKMAKRVKIESNQSED
jgi:hypothetical protein